jgi:hypothetical protein
MYIQPLHSYTSFCITYTYLHVYIHIFNCFNETLKSSTSNGRIQLPSVSAFKLNNDMLPACLKQMYEILMYEAGLSINFMKDIESDKCYISVAHTKVIEEKMIVEETDNEEMIRTLTGALYSSEDLIIDPRTPSRIIICFSLPDAEFIQVPTNNIMYMQ